MKNGNSDTILVEVGINYEICCLFTSQILKLQKIAKEQGMDVESSYQTYIAYDKDGNQTSSGQVTSENQRKTVEKKAESIIYFSHTFLERKTPVWSLFILKQHISNCL
ncbi:hypothetical protein CHR37_09500 [Bacillus velezensis]|uniref:hypothetical protein n=2 Tax=Bacillaceae TaxID=186817 RepID=UPI0004A82B90|nr:hypothetical protein [Bacillus velezensis]AWM44896.1 hypothetical protein BAALB65_12935 [Bacillus amyloliquefaciens]SLB12400.1 Uncharacterised protein [Mycobacteroides abscessus subsp. massiliense]ATU27504.1 hypothetical protein BMJ37_12340 [Bacillus velezensis]AUS15338.1 hypothetical protein C0W57_03695 [Bacillus velezensis]AWQ14089.1 hypothetical protein C1N92_03910 [Bacillus velezensis]